MIDTEPPKKTKRRYTKHGFAASNKIVSTLGYKSVDGRSALAIELKQERRELIAALGGPSEISPQEMAIIDMIAMKRIRRKPIQEWALLNRDALFNRRNKCLAPIALQLEQLEESEVRLLKELGLKRKPKVVSLSDYLTNGKASKAEPVSTPSAVSAHPHTPDGSVSETTETPTNEATG